MVTGVRSGEPVAPSLCFVEPAKCGGRCGSPTAEVHTKACQVPVRIDSAEVLGHQVCWVGEARDLEELEVSLLDLVLKPQVSDV